MVLQYILLFTTTLTFVTTLCFTVLVHGFPSVRKLFRGAEGDPGPTGEVGFTGRTPLDALSGVPQFYCGMIDSISLNAIENCRHGDTYVVKHSGEIFSWRKVIDADGTLLGGSFVLCGNILPDNQEHN